MIDKHLILGFDLYRSLLIYIMCELVLPSSKYRKTYLKALQEFHKEGLNLDIDFQSTLKNFNGLIAYYQNFAKGIDLPFGYVATTQYWLIDEKKYIGRVDIRSQLNVFLERIGGHVSYQIRPSKRKMGYGKILLGLALVKAKEKGLEELLITCKADNIGSQKIIAHWGGEFIDAINRPDTSVKEFRYRLDIEEG
ncbi:MAG: GNAT family N-acetyltransferase [Chitinophagales bacterium]